MSFQSGVENKYTCSSWLLFRAFFKDPSGIKHDDTQCTQSVVTLSSLVQSKTTVVWLANAVRAKYISPNFQWGCRRWLYATCGYIFRKTPVHLSLHPRLSEYIRIVNEGNGRGWSFGVTFNLYMFDVVAPFCAIHFSKAQSRRGYSRNEYHFKPCMPDCRICYRKRTPLCRLITISYQHFQHLKSTTFLESIFPCVFMMCLHDISGSETIDKAWYGDIAGWYPPCTWAIGLMPSWNMLPGTANIFVGLM
jgi:hypothetical protein